MTDDLVKRLRIFAPYDPDQKEAADRIEALEAALKTILADNNKLLRHEIQRICWAALAGEKKSDD